MTRGALDFRYFLMLLYLGLASVLSAVLFFDSILLMQTVYYLMLLFLLCKIWELFLVIGLDLASCAASINEHFLLFLDYSLVWLWHEAITSLNYLPNARSWLWWFFFDGFAAVVALFSIGSGS